MIAKIIIIILMFALIVVVHEWGHYIAAKKNGVLVHEFAIGMGPKLWSVQKGETIYSIRAFPIGGFCSMEGEIEDTQNERAMSSKRPWQKLVIIVAGAVMNFVFAWLLLIILVVYAGYQGNTISYLSDQMPAAAAGLKPGDKIISVDGKKVSRLLDINRITENKDKAFAFEIERDGKKLSPISIRPETIYLINKIDKEKVDGAKEVTQGDQILSIDGVKAKDIKDYVEATKDKNKIYAFEIKTDKETIIINSKPENIEPIKIFRFGFVTEREEANIFQSITLGFDDMLERIRMVWQGLGMLISGQVKLSDMAGFLGIADISAEAWEAGMETSVMDAVMNIIAIAALLSANLGVINLLPLPALDGGRLLFIIFEMLRGKPIDPEKESAIHFVGFVLLMLLTVVVIYNDVMRMIGK